jgi:APA family basic amino acid/polyamine antiporter
MAMVLGIMIGSGIFRTPGIIAAQLGRPWLTFVAWVIGGGVALAGALIFAELATRHPRAGGKYVYAREAFGARIGFVVGVVEVLIYSVAIAALAVVAGEYAGKLAGWGPDASRLAAGGTIVGLTAINLLGASSGRWVQNVATVVKIAALVGVVVVAFVGGDGAGWGGSLPNAPTGTAALVALATTFQSVIFTYYGYPDAAKIAEEVVDPNRTLPRMLLGSVAITTALYVLLNAAFLHVLPFGQVASSNLVAGDVATAILGARGGAVIAGIALVVVLASVNGNVFVTPRVVFAMARDGLGPAVLARVNVGSSPWAAMLVVGGLATALAVSGTFELLLGIAIALVLLIDATAAAALLRLRTRTPEAPFRTPAYPILPIAFITLYVTLFVVGVAADSTVALVSAVVLAVTGGLSVIAVRRAR